MYINVCGGTAQRIGQKPEREAPLDRRWCVHSRRARDGWASLPGAMCCCGVAAAHHRSVDIYHQGAVGGLKQDWEQDWECYAKTKEGSGVAAWRKRQCVTCRPLRCPVLCLRSYLASAQNGDCCAQLVLVSAARISGKEKWLIFSQA